MSHNTRSPNSKHETCSDRAVGPILSLPTSKRAGGTRGVTRDHQLSTVLVIRSPHSSVTLVADHEATVPGLCPDTTVPITICNTCSCPTFQRHLHRTVQDICHLYSSALLKIPSQSVQLMDTGRTSCAEESTVFGPQFKARRKFLFRTT